MGNFHLALAQLRCNVSSKKDNVKRITDSIELASQKQADYILFPELYTSGYSTRERMLQLAETIDGNTVQEVCRYAQKYNIGVIFGFPEIDDTKLYNTAVFISKQGEVLGTYRKIHLPEFENNIFEPGSQCPVFELAEAKIGIMMAYDIEFPEVARILALKGAQVLLVLAANKFPRHPHQNVYLKGRALENHVFVAIANKVGLENNTLFLGESAIIHPFGEAIYTCSNNEELPVISVNLDDIHKARGALDYLQNRRPAVYAKEGINQIPTTFKR